MIIMVKIRIEEEIRIKLAKNLNFIEEGLTLISEEFHLKNPDGAGGFIDIFAKDRDGNLVIIELKRSNAASREAITELSKYIALIRRSKNIKNSEVRLIIISTEWNELLVPFSEYYNATNYQLEGYWLEIDAVNNPIKINKIKPLPLLEGRNICRRHSIRYYKNGDDLKKAKQTIMMEALKLDIKDFILVNFDVAAEHEYYGLKKVLYWSQQLKSKQFYLDKLKEHLDNELFEELLENISDLEDDDALDELADNLENLIDVEQDFFEIGSPEKLVQRLDDKIWTMLNISKYGTFLEDERLTDDLLLMDLKGYTGASFVHYFASTKVENRSKIEEISQKINVSLYHNEEWRHKILDIINYAEKKQNSTITLCIYNRDDILETLWLASIGNPLLWIPSFHVIIDPYSDNNDAEVFIGTVKWEKKIVNVEQAINDCFGNFDDYIFLKHFAGHREKDTDLMKCLGFVYQVDTLVSGEGDQILKENISIKGKNVIERTSPAKMNIYDFIEERKDVTKEIAKLFTNRVVGNGVFRI